MKKKYIALLLTLLALAGCASPAEPEGEDGALIYFLAGEEDAQGGDRICAAREDLGLPDGAGLKQTAEAVMRRLLAGSADGRLASPLPPDTELLGLDVRDRIAYVDLSGTLASLSGVELALADYCMTLSLTALEGIGAATFTAQGRRVGQQPKQVFYERDVLLSNMDDVLQIVEVRLYFLNADGALMPEKRTLSLYEGQSLAESLVAALLEGPENRELIRTLPEGFGVNYVRVDNGVCYVSLPASALDSLPEDEQMQQMILWSLADSLYSIESIGELRLLVDGEELDLFGQVPVETVAVRPQG